MDNQNQNYWQPSVADIRFVQIGGLLLALANLVLAIMVLVYPIFSGILHGSIPTLGSLINPGLGWLILLNIIMAYAKNVLDGQKPKAGTVLDQHILSYFSAHGRRLWWGGILLADAKHEPFSAKHIFDSIYSHIGVQLSLVRLGISGSEIDNALASDQVDWKEFLSSALEFAKTENSHLSWEDLWRSLFSTSKNIQALLDERKITLDEALGAIIWTRNELYYQTPQRKFFADLFTPNRNLNTTWTSRPTPTLDAYSQNLTDLAKVGLMTSAKVREEEVNQAIQILSKSQENNLILVGEPGVGKTSVVGDIALRLIKGDITTLKDFKLIALDINAMIGAGDNFQTIFTRAVDEASASGNTILFIGNLDQFASAKASNGFDLASILSSALEHKGLQLIGTADMSNYKKYIENNSNFAKFFSRVEISELSLAESILVLQENSRKIENRQGVIITLAAIKEAVNLSDKYVHTAKLPEKAEQILDEAAVLVSRKGEKLVTAEHVQEVMSAKTNVPVGDITTDEKSKLANLGTQMSGRVIGQDAAVTAVVEAMQRARLGVSASNKRPIGSFLFLGPTGVGKTETAKALAAAYFGDETKMIRLDMSEFQTPESVYRLTGAPATSGDLALAGGAFTEAVKATPFAVILLDEIEKAHKDVLNIFLAVLDEGRLTDNLGNTIDFTHTIIIATSNAQSSFIQESVTAGMAYDDLRKQIVDRLSQGEFRPEFINRFDGVIVFKPLTQENIAAIAKLKVAKLVAHLKDEKQIDLQVTDAAIAKLAELGYNPAFGARPLERVIRDQVENFVARKLLETSSSETLVFDLPDIN